MRARATGQRVFGDIAALGDNDGERLADIAHLVLGETGMRAQIEDDALDRRRRHQQGPGLPEIAEVVRGIGGDNALARQSRGDINRDQLSVRDRAAQQRGIEHAGNFEVVDKQRLAGEELPVLVAADGGAKIAGFTAAHVRIRSAASSTASTMCW